jgi:hypothetical protein
VTNDSSGKQTLAAEATYDYPYVIPRKIGGIDGGSSTLMHFRSEISSTMGDGACIYALNPTAPRAVDASGSTLVSIDGCIIASNSNADDSIYVGGSSSLSADCLQAAGEIEATGGLTTDCAQNREHAWRLPDPFKDLVEPVPPILMADPKKSDTNIAPGRYNNLTLDGTKTLAAGLYYIEGSLTIKGEISGTDVTFFLADGGITANGNASFNVDAPKTGPYAGLLFWSARSNTSDHIFNGTGATDLNGYLYFPSSDVSYTGNNTTGSTCLRIVADTIELTGSSTIRSDCTDELGGREARVSGPLFYSK